MEILNFSTTRWSTENEYPAASMRDFSGSSSFAAASRSCKTEISIASNTSLCTGIARLCCLSKSWKMVKVGRLKTIGIFGFQHIWRSFFFLWAWWWEFQVDQIIQKGRGPFIIRKFTVKFCNFKSSKPLLPLSNLPEISTIVIRIRQNLCCTSEIPNFSDFARFFYEQHRWIWKMLWDPCLGVCDSVRQTRISSWDAPITIFWLAWIIFNFWSNFAPIVIFFEDQSGTTTGSIWFKSSTDGTRPFFVYSETSNRARVILRVDCLTDLTAKTIFKISFRWVSYL